jgi:deoxyribose-phosphate aldolase
VEKAELARIIDSTLLRPDATEEEVVRHCEEAAALGCATAVVLPIHLVTAVSVLDESETKVCVPAGFPMGGAALAVLESEVEYALEAGADEIDMVMPHSLFRGGRHGEMVEYIASAAGAIHDQGKTLKVIIETAIYGEDDIRRAARLTADGGADLVKTSTGFYGDATVEAVKTVRSALPFVIGVKASGGISSYEKALEMVNAGADRIGTSSAAAILA